MQTRVESKPSTTKRMIIMIVGVLVLIAVIAGIKVLLIMKMLSAMKPPPPAVVTTARSAYEEWQPELRAVGTLRAARGADLALEVAGLVGRVNVRSGEDVKAGQLLLELVTTDEVANLRQLEAQTALSRLTFERAKQQIAVHVIAQADYDNAAADLKVKEAAVAQQQAIISKKQLRAPFAGRAGIVTITPGTYLNAGTVIVTLQELDPVYVDFFVPQKNLAQVQVGRNATLTLDAFPGRTFPGTVNAVSPKVDTDTRNVLVEARVPNHDRVLSPGMFVNVAVDVGSQQRYLTLPQTAIIYNPYGETVYVVRSKREFDADQSAAKQADPVDDKTPPPKKAGKGPPPVSADALVVEQAFVTSGPTRGDQVAILAGLKPGVEVVTSGQIKLKNGAPVRIDNRVRPTDSPNPAPQEH
ncbi:MAG TPA: efflux RND transporter periplasmic adaptor subunit [Steroidobacteraceae bacterium]|nr:efflux RND transporter periplasmic adaptor subunit [Steroidobacteraceae bacterium]